MNIHGVIIKRIFLFFLILMFLPGYSLAQNVPHEVGGIALGTDIEEYPDLMASNFMKEVVVTDRHGFRKGVVSYGVCKYKGKILKIRLKYKDKSKSFYKTLLGKYREKYGPPDSWDGDSFGLTHIWKWRFVDKDQNRITLNLQYNSKDPDETIGNTVKLFYPDRIEEERICFNHMCNMASKKLPPEQKKELEKSDWNYLIPR